MKRAIAILLCLAIVIGLTPAILADESGSKIDLSGVNASDSLEIWGFSAANLTDGDLNTMYCSETSGTVATVFKEVSLVFDLGNTYTIDQFKYFSYAAGDQGRPNNIAIEASTDGEAWTEAYKNENVPLTTVADSVEYGFTFPATEARYVRFTVKGVAANWDLGPCVCLREIEIYSAAEKEEVTPIGEKLALSGATASESLEMWGFGVANLIDGNLNTTFASESTGAGVTEFKETWITLNLGGTYMVDQFKYFSYAAGDQGRPSNIVIEASTDGETWTEAYKNENVPLTTVADSVEYAFTFKAVEACYVRLTVKGVAANWDLGPCVCLREIEIYGTTKTEEGGDDEVITPVGEKLALGGVNASASLEIWGFGAANLIDGSLDTMYCSESTGAGAAAFQEVTLTFDLSNTYMVDQFKYFSYAAGEQGRPNNIVIEASTDGETWTEAYKNENVPLTTVADSVEYAFTFKAVEARYVRLTVKGVAANWDLGPCVCLREIEIYGTTKTEEGGDDEVITPVGEKLALGGVNASASLEIWGFGAANLIDGSLDTMYCSESTGAGAAAFQEVTLTFDLSNTYMVDQFKYFSYAAGEQGRPSNIVIEASTDGETWTEAYKNESVPLTTVADSVEYAFTFKAVEARYVRLTVKGVAANWDLGPCVCLREIEIYGTTKTEEGGDGEVITPVGEKIDLTGYVAGMTSASGFAQNVVSSNYSEEAWGLGVAALIDGKTVGDPRYIGTGTGSDTFVETWIQVDLQKVYSVDKFAFYSWHYNNTPGMPVAFTIETSEDGKNWTVVHTETDLKITSVPNSNLYEFAFKAVDARYVKLNVTAIGSNADTGAHLCLCEVEVYGVDPAADEEEVALGEKLNIKVDKVIVSGEYTPDMGKNNLFDGNLETIYAAIDPSKAPATRMDEWVQIDLQQSYTVNRIRLANRSNALPLGGLPSVFDVMVSDDGENWKVVKSVNGISVSDITEEHWLTVDFDAVDARFVRVRAYDIGEIAEASLGYAMTLREFEVHTAEGKIDLSSYVNLEDWSGHPGPNSQWTYYASNYPQNIVTASQSYELWGWGIAGLIDGMVGNEAIFCCRPSSDAIGPIQALKNEITVDLEAAYFLDGMRFASMAANSLAGLPIDFKLEVSLTGAEWTTVLNKTGLSTDDADKDGQYYTFAFNPTKAIRFVRLTVTKVSEKANEFLGYCAALSELELYGTMDPTTIIKPDGYGKIDLGKAVVRATNSYNLWGHGTGNLYNGNQNQYMFIGTSVDDADYYAMFKDTEVFENTSNEFLKIRLDGIYEIDLMRFQSQWIGSGRGVPNSYTLEVSMDGETWETALFVDGKAVSDTDWYSDDIAPVKTRYLRLKFHNFIEAGDLGYAAHLKELEFYGVMVEKDQIDLDVPAPEPPALEPLPGDNPPTGNETILLVGAVMAASVLMLAVLVLNRRKYMR